MVEHLLLEGKGKTSIETITTSDHAPITAEVKIGEDQNKVNTWRINDKIMQNLEVERKIKKESNIL